LCNFSLHFPFNYLLFNRKNLKNMSALGIVAESPQVVAPGCCAMTEDLQRKARPEGERPNNYPTKVLLLRADVKFP